MGGIITGATPRRTPRGKRHNTSVQAEDVEAALAIAGVSQLPTLIEEEADSKTEETEEVPDQEISVTKRPRGRPSKAASKVSSPSLNVISEDVEAEPVKPSTSRGKRKQVEDDVEDVPTPPAKRASRSEMKQGRVTITTLDTDVDLLSPLVGVSERRKSASSRSTTQQKKYVPVKKKTSVRIK